MPVSYLPSDLFDWWDKAQHVFAFFCLCILGVFAYQNHIVRVVIGLFFYGGLIEILQWLTGWRSGELWDWLADAFGVFFGWILIRTLIQNKLNLCKSKLFRDP
jgi:VanZ family protein